MNGLRSKKRRFKCKSCGKKSWDQGEQDKEKLPENTEFEFLDLCPKCFKQYRKDTTQTWIILDLHKQGKITKEEMEQLYVLQKSGDKEAFKKFKTILFRKNENVKGHIKHKKFLMISNLLVKKY